MTNYIIHGNIDFFTELMKNNDDNENENNKNNNAQKHNTNNISDLKDLCLISNEPLDKTEIRLECNHKFNYKNLYSEVIINQKSQSYNYFETDKITTHQIKCPYCRKIINNLLPMTLDIEGVQNKLYINQPKNFCMKIKCEFKCNDESSCDLFSYITPEGKFCKIHYNKIIRQKNKPEKLPKKQKINDNEKQTNIETEDFSEEMKLFGKSRTVAYLKNVLKENNKKVSGTKNELIKRIYQHDLHKIIQ